MGVDRHQLDILTVRFGINKAAAQRAAGAPLPWQALTQIMLLGMARADGSPYTVHPDVFVVLHPVERNRGSYSLTEDGPPALIVEVASESTYRADLDLERGMGWTYLQAGVLEYLVLDPTAQWVPESGRGWRLEGSEYVPWPVEGGRWRSRELGVSIGIEDGLAAVYGADGRRQLREGKIGAFRADGARPGAARPRHRTPTGRVGAPAAKVPFGLEL